APPAAADYADATLALDFAQRARRRPRSRRRHPRHERLSAPERDRHRDLQHRPPEGRSDPEGPGFGPVSCTGFGGLHVLTTSEPSRGRPAGRPICFTIIPTDCSGDVPGTVALISHEDVEAATDPLPLAHWIDQSTRLPLPGGVPTRGRLDRPRRRSG